VIADALWTKQAHTYHARSYLSLSNERTPLAQLFGYGPSVNWTKAVDD